MNNYSCIIIDDELNATELLKSILSRIRSTVKVEDVCTSWNDALRMLQTKEYDIIFLDISMQERNGIDLLKFNPDLKSEVIFITAHSEYALEAFKYTTSGYILKPIDELELSAALTKAISRLKNKSYMAQPKHVSPHKIGIPEKNGVLYVDIDDILYCEALNSYTKVVVKDSEITTSYNLGKFKQLLPEDIFYQVHRSFLVNLNFIKRYDASGFIVMSNNIEIPLTQANKNEFLNLFTRLKPSTRHK